MPDSLLVCLPTRAKTTTSAAVRAILEQHPPARVLVYHNYVQPPSDEVRDDLARLPPGVTLLEEQVGPEMTIGQIRERVTRLALAREPFAIASADDDITGYLRPGTYARALTHLQTWEAVCFRRYLELEGLENNVNLLLLAILSNAQSFLRARMGVAAPMVGAGSVFRASALRAAGGYPALALGEDLAMRERLGGGVLTLPEDGVFCDCRKQMGSLDVHYDEWAHRVDLPATGPPPADELLPGGPGIISAWVREMFAGAIHHLKQPALQREALVFHARLQELALRLPSLAGPERLQAVEGFRRDPPGPRP